MEGYDVPTSDKLLSSILSKLCLLAEEIIGGGGVIAVDSDAIDKVLVRYAAFVRDWGKWSASAVY
jgi:hypothetical protein